MLNIVSKTSPRTVAPFSSDRCGSAAVEFALVLPFLLGLMLCSVEVSRFIWLNKKSVQVANAMGEMLSSTQAALAGSDLQFISDAGMIIAPQVLTDARSSAVSWGSILKTSFSSIVITPQGSACTSNCTYIANVAWSAGPQQRPCGQLTASADTAGYSPTTLPQSLFQTGSVIVVDSQYTYQPLFGSTVVPAKLIIKSAFFIPRYLNNITLGDTTSGSVLVTRCPGY